jgi:hypothetical protein
MNTWTRQARRKLSFHTQSNVLVFTPRRQQRQPPNNKGAPSMLWWVIKDKKIGKKKKKKKKHKIKKKKKKKKKTKKIKKEKKKNPIYPYRWTPEADQKRSNAIIGGVGGSRARDQGLE